MIRFIDLGKQIGLDEEWPREFAFFDTCTARFVEFNGEQVWESWEDFISCFLVTPDRALEYVDKEFRKACPDWVFATVVKSDHKENLS